MTLANFTKRTPWKAKRRQPERSLHRTVAYYLDIALPRDVYWYPVPNGAHMGSRMHAAMMIATGQLQSGVPDIGLVIKGRAVFIELKAGKNKPTPDQLQAHLDITLAGGVVGVCYSIDDVRDFLELIGVKLKKVSLP